VEGVGHADLDTAGRGGHRKARGADRQTRRGRGRPL